jgi:peptidoglycan hydrolase-like protein with peptidoglycan-binding domain
MGPLPIILGGGAVLLALAFGKKSSVASLTSNPQPTPYTPPNILPPGPTPPKPVPPQDLPMGTSGGASKAEITCLQTQLSMLRSPDGAGYNTGGIDGVWTSGTSSALAKFQKDAGLPVTGSIDAATRSAEAFAMCFSASAPQPSSGPDMTGGATAYQIRCLQSALNNRYNDQNVKEDGLWSSALGTVVSRAQTDAGQAVTGRITPELLAQAGCSAAAPTVYPSTFGDTIACDVNGNMPDAKKTADLKAAINASTSEADLNEFANFCLSLDKPCTGLHDYALARIVGMRENKTTEQVLQEQHDAAVAAAQQAGGVVKDAAGNVIDTFKNMF